MKFDSYRVEAHKASSRVVIYSRNGTTGGDQLRSLKAFNQPPHEAKDTKDRNCPSQVAPRRPMSCKLYAKHTNGVRNIVQFLLTYISKLHIETPFDHVIHFV